MKYNVLVWPKSLHNQSRVEAAFKGKFLHFTPFYKRAQSCQSTYQIILFDLFSNKIEQ